MAAAPLPMVLGAGSLNPMSFTENQHGNGVLERLRQQQKTGNFCDVILLVRDRQFNAHRNILAAVSPYFDSILRTHKVVKEQVTVNCQNPDAFELLLNYMYSGSVVIDRNCVADLLKLANNFLVTKLKNYCAEYLDRCLDAANCIMVKELATKYNMPGLVRNACDFLDTHICQVLMHSAELLDYSYAQIKKFLNVPTYRVAITPDVYLKFATRWTGRNYVEREMDFKDLLQNAPHFNRIRAEFFFEILETDQLFSEFEQARLALLLKMYETSIPLNRYEADFSALCAKYGVNLEYYNRGDAAGGQVQQYHLSHHQQHYSSADSAPNGVVYANANELPSTSDATPVKSENAPPELTNDGDHRPALKLTLKLPLLNKKTRILGKQHRMYRKAVTAANQTLLKRRGRPPKFRARIRGVEPQALMYADRGIGANDIVEYSDDGGDDGGGGERGATDDGALMVDEQIAALEGDAELEEEQRRRAMGPHNCPQCAFSAANQARMRAHISRAHSRNIIFICMVCQFECKWNREYYSHMKTHFPGPQFACDQENCNYNTDRIQLLLSHRLKHTDDRPFKCTQCEYKSRTRVNLLSHLHGHTGEKPFSCPECGRGFAIKSTLDQHLATHSDTRPFQCEQCSFSTKYQSHLISHKRIHTGDVFKCHFVDCNYSSPKKSQLAAHLRTHLAVRAHKCGQCNRSFIEKSHLVRHERIHLADKPFKCEHCDYASSRRDKLKEHIQKHHGSQASSKQHRRRHRRAKQLAQLAAQARQQVDSVALLGDRFFQPIAPAPGGSSGPPIARQHSITKDVTAAHYGQQPPQQQQQQQQQELEKHNRVMGDEEQPRTITYEAVPAPGANGNTTTMAHHLQHHHMHLQQQQMPSPLLAGRPSSAVFPGQQPMGNPSPALSLNFALGSTGFDTPVLALGKDVVLGGQVANPTPTDSLVTPEPLNVRSPQSMCNSLQAEPFPNVHTPGGDLQRPVSLPPLGGQPWPSTTQQQPQHSTDFLFN